MPVMEGRAVGEALRREERELLDLLCAGGGPAAAVARAQLASARWGGYEHGTCGCFLVRCEASLLRIPHDGGPFSTAEVFAGDAAVGILELWVVDGRLHSVTYMPFGDDHVDMPSAAQCRTGD